MGHAQLTRAGSKGPGVLSGRPARYTLVSVGCGALAQAGLALAYGVFGWGTAAAVLFSLAVSVGPSYWGSRTYVWKGLGRDSRRREFGTFVCVALAGTGVAIALTSLTHLAGSALTDDRTLLTVWVCAGSVLATVVVWISRYALLDRCIFRPRP